MRRAIVELRECASYRKGSWIFVKNIPQTVEGDRMIDFFKGRKEFSVRYLDPVPEPKVQAIVEEEVEEEIEADDSDLPPPAEPVKMELPSLEKKKRVVKKRKE